MRIARACVFAAAVQGCSKHAGKPVTANQARGNHPSAQRREPTIPHFLCLSLFLRFSLDLFFSLSHAFYTTPLLQYFLQFYENVTLRLKAMNTKKKKNLQTSSFVGIPILYVCFLSLITVMCPLIGTFPLQHTNALACGGRKE